VSDSNREKVLYCVEYLAEKVWFFFLVRKLHGGHIHLIAVLL